MDFILQLTIYSGFLGLNDLYKLSIVNKFINSISKKNIEKYYEILRKCSQIEPDEHLRYNTIWDTTFPGKFFTFDNDKSLFCKNLNIDGMAFYYSYFVFRYHVFYRVNDYSKFWRCVLCENGYIKIISSNFNIDRIISDRDIILNIDIHYSFLSFRNHPKKLQYWGTVIRFENKGKEIKPRFVNVKLLDKLITSDKYQSMILKNYCKLDKQNE